MVPKGARSDWGAKKKEDILELARDVCKGHREPQRE